MKSEKRQRINEIFVAALPLAAHERGLFIRDACDGDESVRREVESLLGAHEAAKGFLETPAIAAVADEVLAPSKLAKGQRLGQYKILKEIGKGGQGTVYQALDTKLNRTVAIKLLPPELTANEINRKRFQREAQIASALDHPNICTIHDFAELGGQHFIVMQFVPGRNVREMVAARPLELLTAMKIAIQVCDGLAAAHARGVIHRDIKAQNVIVTDSGQVRILDFGLAKLTSANSAEQTELTVQGSPYGTPTYAAPEQSRGDAVDHRADIFSTGVLLYEMLTGTWPFHGRTAVDVRHAVLHETAKPITERRGVPVPEKLELLVSRALEKDPRARFQDIVEMRDELIGALRELPQSDNSETTRFLESFRAYVPRRVGGWTNRAKAIAAGALLLIVMLGSYFAYRAMHSGTVNAKAEPASIDSIAVMPFINAGHDQNAEYLSDGITESLINRLSQIPSLRVMSRSAVFRYKDKETTAKKIGEELNVRAVLKGDVRQIGDQISIDVELVDATDEHQIWGDQYVRKFADVLAIQREIAQEISAQLRLKLSGAEKQQLAKNFTESAEAYQLYLKGRFYWNKRTEDSYQKAIDYFHDAIAKDPNYALAYTGLADSYSFLSSQGIRAPGEVFPLAKDAAMRAASLDDSLAEAHASLGYVKLYYDWDWNGAAQEYKRAIDLNPNYATAHHGYAYYLVSIGRTEGAIAEIKRAQELDPLSLIINTDYGEFYYFAHRPDQAIEQLRRALDLDGGFVRAHFLLARAYAQKGDCNQAMAEFQKANELEAKVEMLGALGQGYASCGRKIEARRVLNQLIRISKQRYVSPHWIASIYAGLGENDAAFEWLDKAVEKRFGPLIYLKVNPIWDNLRSDPRFPALVARVGIP